MAHCPFLLRFQNKSKSRFAQLRYNFVQIRFKIFHILNFSFDRKSRSKYFARKFDSYLSNLSLNVTTPHQSGAPFVDERVFQNRGVCRQAFPRLPTPTPVLQFFALAPIFARPECGKIRSHRNACYAGYMQRPQRSLSSFKMAGGSLCSQSFRV